MRTLPVKRRAAGSAAKSRSSRPRPAIKGRAVPYDPPNRFERVHVEMDPGRPEDERPRTEFLADATRKIVARNRSPDIHFGASVNPYRGCEHGCVYCYARPTHEYLGFSSGLDFERKILVKRRAPQLLREALSAPSWRPQVIGISGVTDAYQPVERRLRLTRGCLAVLRDFRNPVTIVTKNHLVTRDVDILAELAEHDCVRVTISVTTLRNELQRVMEPRTSVPGRRLAAIRQLSSAGVPVGVFVAPLIPGLTDDEMPAIVAAAARAGARYASFLLLRLPRGVADHFTDWLDAHFPGRKEKVLGRIRDVRGGKLNESGFHRRFRGRGQYADQLAGLFGAAARKARLEGEPPPLSTAAFRRDGGVQPDLFAD